MKLAIPVDESRKKILKVFGTAPQFLIYDTETEEINFLKNIYACGGCKSGCGEGKNAADLLAENSIDALLTAEIAEAPFLKLIMRKIAVYKLPAEIENTEEAISYFKEGKAKISYRHF
ncbi:NifB/NifX family molybdenum-iron cluster-binding protein [Desulfurobacterium atlanticum]|uniref:Predicted Fe-Mo cluster-binding protein, NifX family n=1 Tax=Desulfurobacterium atlanticum TaxID=240169 RepID=A0A238YD45_9BACT|nr:NifB/NifX family molybdenum-iron cluster-binding protein [Desulfurobacterium atlanticum]SNR69135.1 Predicted Fe-Mo cluster-binding protein, NifX family [Desulfurobacterium atlanticum]